MSNSAKIFTPGMQEEIKMISASQPSLAWLAEDEGDSGEKNYIYTDLLVTDKR